MPSSPCLNAHRRGRAAALAWLACSCLAQQAQAQATVPDRMARVAQSMADRGLFSGAVLVARGDEVLLNRAYGKASLVWDIDNQPGHRFLLASVSKQFTAAAVLRLADQGRLQLTDPLQQHLPDLPEAWRAITVQQLLTHTSGIPNYTEADNFGVTKTQRATPLELLAPMRALPLDFAPGSKMHYSNSGYLLLGLLIEQLSGQSYADFMQAQVFNPLGMADSGMARSDMTIEHLVSGHVREGHTLRPANFTDLSVPYAAGALYGTTGDLLKWQRGLYGGQVISPASLQAMTTPAHEDHALGLVVGHRGAQPYYWHSGSIDGFSTFLQYEPQQKLSFAALANEQNAGPQLLVRRLSILARGGQVVLPEERKPVSLPPETLARFVGAYQTPSADITWVALRGQHLWAKASQHPWEPLQPQSATVSWAPSLDIELRFAPGPDPQGPKAPWPA